ncbi:DUF2391 family protein [Halalkalicoccus jeotgali]|uniref:Integral membrane protein n=1 Tax=Halalkalicoccus jeotgali (strain DSM 18796 / CECT 7217 / JCM 14584 / KCTC 4019 / B3) TaxID=795797 RepID=D8J8N3_HALJB|nr:DUF2391 family protein [Halalkalicoccus jeotgali]ADJ14218.1 hypothetical protein HacjB3_04135 [Halalkalicoccus jeotgali B3]ELY34600.1 hypothetical protein C497_15158 [Halalkalicoccus jeotgali B3]
MRRPRRPRFRPSDVAQQVVGGFLLAGPFVVTEEVWTLAATMARWQALATAGLVGLIGYGALYSADRDRDPEAELDVGGIPLRFVSLMVVAFGSVALLAVLFDAPDAFDAGWSVALRAICIGAVFSVVGAATADSVF